MIGYLFQALLILTLFYGAYRIFLKKMTFFSDNRYFLLTGMLLALIIPLLPLDFSTVRTEYIYADGEALALSQAVSGPETASTVLPVSWSLLEFLVAIYLIGVFTGLVFLLVRLYKVLQIIRNGRKIKENGLSIIYTEKEISPFSFFNQIVINPGMHNDEDLAFILVHEEIHTKQFHQVDLMLSELTKILLWFYPPAYGYQKYVKNNLEYLTDNRSLKKGLDRKGYQLLLINVSRNTLNESLINNFSKKLIKERIKMINKNQTATAHKRVYIPLMLILGLLCLGVGVSAQSEGEKIETKVIVKEAENPETITESETSSNQDENEMRMEYTFDETVNPDEVYDSMRVVLPTGPDSDSIDLKNVSEIIMKDVNGTEVWIVKYKDGIKIDTLYTKDPNTPSDRFLKYRDLFGSAADIDFEELKKLSPKGIDAQNFFEEKEKGFEEHFQPFHKGKDGNHLSHSDSVRIKKVKIKDYKTGKKHKYTVDLTANETIAGTDLEEGLPLITKKGEVPEGVIYKKQDDGGFMLMIAPKALYKGSGLLILKEGVEISLEEFHKIQDRGTMDIKYQSVDELKKTDSKIKRSGIIIVTPKKK